MIRKKTSLLGALCFLAADKGGSGGEASPTPDEQHAADLSQTELPEMKGPGVASQQIDELDKLAKKYANRRDARMLATRAEVNAKQDLIDALHKHEDTIGRGPDGSLTYQSDSAEVIVTLKPTGEELKVKAVPED